MIEQLHWLHKTPIFINVPLAKPAHGNRRHGKANLLRGGSNEHSRPKRTLLRGAAVQEQAGTNGLFLEGGKRSTKVDALLLLTTHIGEDATLAHGADAASDCLDARTVNDVDAPRGAREPGLKGG